jgi:hypothetical protein
MYYFFEILSVTHFLILMNAIGSREIVGDLRESELSHSLSYNGEHSAMHVNDHVHEFNLKS